MTLPDGTAPLAAVPLIAALALACGAVRRNAALCGALLGVALAAGLGWAGVAMLGTLLAAGTLVSERAHRHRDSVQVLCNGGVAAAGAMAALAGFAWGPTAAAGALSAALSDTVSGEWGRRYGGRPRLLLFGAAAEPGADGAMSAAGTLLGMVAGLPVPLAGWAAGAPLDGISGVAWIALAGLFGNVCDSVLGLFVQPHLGARGNDWVNLLATACGAVAAATLAA